MDKGVVGPAVKTREDRKECQDCGAQPGELHKDGCDTERCPYCGGQALSCWSDTPDHRLMATCHNMWVLDGDRMPWTGEWPGVADCRELGLWCKWTSNGWQTCDKDDPEATEDLNRLCVEYRWDPKRKKYVSREEANAV